LCRAEIEADYIGIILLAASGFDPHIAPHFFEKLKEITSKCMFNNILYLLALSTHPSLKKRSQLLSRPKVMEEAMGLYTQVTSTGQGPNKAYLPDLKL
jgi:predicted Zn-dependent protease